MYDKDTGLVRFGFRDYDSAIGRWAAKDPIDFAGGDLNLYGYVENKPTIFIDPTGEVKLNIYTDKKIADAINKLPSGMSDLKNDLNTPAKLIDRALHHEIFIDVPGTLLIKPTVDIDWKEMKINGEGLEIKYEVPLDGLIKFIKRACTNN